MPRIVQPSVLVAAFNCPHCGALASQTWYHVYARQIDGDGLPFVATNQRLEEIRNDRALPDEVRDDLVGSLGQLLNGLVRVSDETDSKYVGSVNNLQLTKCFHCKKACVWVHDRVVFPSFTDGPEPNPDLPDDIVRDFTEARAIADLSPRGASALLRLCIQKLCKHLGLPGNRIDDDIAALVQKGLNPIIQQSLDIVRVIGNESVHPGEMDLRDDRDTALRLFDLVNAIAEQMISHPKAVKAMYEKLPESKRKAIEKRDKRS
jgi:hypothetical protein